MEITLIRKNLYCDNFHYFFRSRRNANNFSIDGSPETILPALRGSSSNPTIPTLMSLDTLGSLTRAGILLDSSEVTPSPRRSDVRRYYE